MSFASLMCVMSVPSSLSVFVRDITHFLSSQLVSYEVKRISIYYIFQASFIIYVWYN